MTCLWNLKPFGAIALALLFLAALWSCASQATRSVPCSIDGKACVQLKDCDFNCKNCRDSDKCRCKHTRDCKCEDPTGLACCAVDSGAEKQ